MRVRSNVGWSGSWWPIARTRARVNGFSATNYLSESHWILTENRAQWSIQKWFILAFKTRIGKCIFQKFQILTLYITNIENFVCFLCHESLAFIKKILCQKFFQISRIDSIYTSSWIVPPPKVKISTSYVYSRLYGHCL